MTHKNQLYIPAEDFYLQPIYSCIHCRANLAHHRDLISKSFQGSQGRAYLFNNVVNVGSLVAEERMLLTGLHYVADIYCECCSFILGWKYERAFEPNQRYKEGKFIIELANLIKDNCWDIEFNKLKLRLYPIKVQQLFDTDWNMSIDSLSKNSNPRQNDESFLMKFQSKTTFIRELSRDFQQLFGISDKLNSSNNDRAIQADTVIFTDEISNSTMSTSIERPDPDDSYTRVSSARDPASSLTDSMIQGLTTSPSPIVATPPTRPALTQAFNSSGVDNSSLNTSLNSTKGLLEASCSSEKRAPESDGKVRSRPTTGHHSAHSGRLVPFPDTNSCLSGVVGTSSKVHSKHHPGRSRHKCRSRHSSNVVNPQKSISAHSKKKSSSSSSRELPSINKSCLSPPNNNERNV